ncbi:MAG: 2,3,4,5-tetrahydropyridine-2,6-dicarboxylate N-succinyltransferase [Acidobacteriota bacterium]|nr:2,3,4,5-tetrahydropyridine-2,6-dicarboxylate N-succinyltransferase [Blastocatellia bacterium]MDW8239228.1 2,3,4,5-tetrahydropyridine-2,6-dicarboxylate N-succinyltransferase [Acidobacteriota bacterium]
MMDLQQRIEELFAAEPDQYGQEYFDVFDELKRNLNEGTVRAAVKQGDRWVVNQWVKKGILLGFRIGVIQDVSVNDKFPFFDKSTYPLKRIRIEDGVRIVPGGSAIRDGCYVGRGVVCMPPMYINVGAYVDDGTMIDSHALVGSCAQIGKRVHLSAGAQIGGVLEPVGSMPVIIEDDVLIGGNCGVYEGAIVRQGAILGAGTILTGSTPVYDMVREAVYRKTDEAPLEIPANAVVVPGSRAISKGRGREWGLSLYTPVIIKYRDAKTAGSIQLEELLR